MSLSGIDFYMNYTELYLGFQTTVSFKIYPISVITFTFPKLSVWLHKLPCVNILQYVWLILFPVELILTIIVK